MDPTLRDAAEDGNVVFLKEAVRTIQPPEYFLARSNGENIFHIAACLGKVEFLEEDMKILPTNILKKLLFQATTESRYTVLHKDIIVVKCIRKMYASLSWDDDDHVKPWLAVSWKHETPLNLALDIDEPNEDCAMEILLMDPELKSWTIADKYGNTPLFYAIKRGFNLVAKNILMSHFPSTSLVGSTSLSSLLSLAATNCSEVRLLFKTFGQWMDKIDTKGYSVLHEWAETGEARLCELLLEDGDVGDARTKIFRECIFEKEKKAFDTPLHLSARKKDSELASLSFL